MNINVVALDNRPFNERRLKLLLISSCAEGKHMLLGTDSVIPSVVVGLADSVLGFVQPQCITVEP